MDPDSFDQKLAPRKMRFKPKSQSQRRLVKSVAPKVEATDDGGSDEAKELMRRFQDSLTAKPKAEKKGEAARVIFGGSSNPSHQYNSNYSKYEEKARVKKGEKEYQEPWNYYGYYPTVLPLRRPYSGKPEKLDEEEFEQASVFDEENINAAEEIGLMEENSEPKMLFFQLPRNLPMPKRANTAGGEASNSKPSGGANRPCVLNELKSGYMGKMLVYKSGAVKLKLGETLYDVNPGSDCGFAEDVVAVNPEKKEFCAVGELGKHVILTPDINSILDNFDD